MCILKYYWGKMHRGDVKPLCLVSGSALVTDSPPYIKKNIINSDSSGNDYMLSVINEKFT